MLALLAAATQLFYSFPVGVHRTYDLQVSFEGYIPILGGRQGKVEVSMLVDVAGETPGDKGQPRATSEIKDLKVIFNGAQMPFGPENIKAFFPKTTISMTPQGKMVATNAPDTKFPFRLPGLDAKRFPDITYLPIEFPSEGVEVDKAWSFKKLFGGNPMDYTVTPTAIDDAKAEMKIALKQEETTFEDSAKTVVESEAAATYRIETKLAGEGKATFDRKLNLVTLFEGESKSESVVTNLQTRDKSQRNLAIKIRVILKQPV